MNKHPFLILIGGMLSLMIAMGIGRFAYTPILPLMQNALSFSDAVAGYLASSNYAGYLIGAMLAGILSLNEHRTFHLRIHLLLSIVTTISMGLVDSYIFMAVIRFLSGVASAFIFVLASSIILDHLAMVRKMNWSGLFYAGVGFGIFLSSTFILVFNHVFSWKVAWIGLGFLCVVLTIFVWVWVPHSPSNKEKKVVQAVITKALPINWLPWLIIAYGLEGLGYIVTGTFIVSITERAFTYISDPTFVWGVVGLSAIPSCILWSTLAKKWGDVKALVLAMILQAIGIALPVLWGSSISFITSAILFGATFMGITTIVTTIARQMNPQNSSRIIGYLTAVYATGQMIGPTIAGLVLAYLQRYDYALICAAIAVLLGALLLVNGIFYDQVQNKEISS